jgi:hypothetical protein
MLSGHRGECEKGFMTTHRLCTISVFLVISLVAQVGVAATDSGLQAGNLKISPGLTINGGYDTNVFSSSTEAGESGGPSVFFQPFLGLETSNTDLFDVSLNTSLGWRQYVAEDESISGQSGLSANAGANLSINRRGMVSLTLSEQLQRSNDTPSSPGDEPFNRLTNRAGVVVGVHPGVFQHFLGYEFAFFDFSLAEDLNRTEHSFSLNNYWQFLPQTVLLLNGSYGMVGYESPTSASFGGVKQNIESTPVRLEGGLRGSLTRRVSLTALGGYGMSLHSAGDSYNNFLADGRLNYSFGDVQMKNRVFVGYKRGFEDSTIASFATFDRPYVGYDQSLNDGQVKASLLGELTLRSYTGLATGPGLPAAVNDKLLRLVADISLDLTRWWSVGGGYAFSGNFTDDSLDSTATSSQEAVRAYSRHFVNFGTTIAY